MGWVREPREIPKAERVRAVSNRCSHTVRVKQNNNLRDQRMVMETAKGLVQYRCASSEVRKR